MVLVFLIDVVLLIAFILVITDIIYPLFFGKKMFRTCIAIKKLFTPDPPAKN